MDVILAIYTVQHAHYFKKNESLTEISFEKYLGFSYIRFLNMLVVGHF